MEQTTITNKPNKYQKKVMKISK